MTHPQKPRRRWSVAPWPWPGDNATDKARHVASSYRTLCQRFADGKLHNPTRAVSMLDEHWQRLGQFWIAPTEDLPELDEWVSAADAAQLVSRTPKDIYNWAHLGHIEQRPDPEGAPDATGAPHPALNRQKSGGLA